MAQQPHAWQPTRMQITPAARSVPQANQPSNFTTAEGATNDGVVFRWRRSNLVNQASGAQNSQAASRIAPAGSTTGYGSHGSNFQTRTSVSVGDLDHAKSNAYHDAQPGFVPQTDSNLRTTSKLVRPAVDVVDNNPLRQSSRVELANFQQVPVSEPDPFLEQLQPPPGQLPTLPQSSLQPQLPQSPLTPLPEIVAPPSLSAPGLSAPGLSAPSRDLLNDPLSTPESAPMPGSPLGGQNNNSRRSGGAPEEPPKLQLPDATAPAPDRQPEDASPFDRLNPQTPSQKGDENSVEESDKADKLALPDREKNAANNICQDQRQRARAPLSELEINTSPEYGEGIRPNRVEQTKLRGDFLARSAVRQWADVHGNLVATGKMVDLKNAIVTLDENGSYRRLPLRDLSDADYNYAMKLWNLPTGCGSGDENFDGRNYIASSFQFKASGLCHKPLYFEEVQLERYGHEVGPVLQPLISSVHFFGNIAVLPYKMGIHPMHECQYALGYYRPGDCAPYMIPPIPWSIPGAISQARVVVGGAALIP